MQTACCPGLAGIAQSSLGEGPNGCLLLRGEGDSGSYELAHAKEKDVHGGLVMGLGFFQIELELGPVALDLNRPVLRETQSFAEIFFFEKLSKEIKQLKNSTKNWEENFTINADYHVLKRVLKKRSKIFRN